MIGVSRNTYLAKPSKREVKKLIKSQGKVVEHSTGKKSVPFCYCGNPIHTDLMYSLGNKPKRLVCPLCFYVKNLDIAPTSDIGFLIYTPELTQEKVTSYAIMLHYIKMSYPSSEDLMGFYTEQIEQIRRLVDPVEVVLGEGASNPSIMCQYLSMMSDDDYSKRDLVLKDIKLFPSYHLVKEQLVFMKTNVLKNYAPSKWVGLLQEVNKKTI